MTKDTDRSVLTNIQDKFKASVESEVMRDFIKNAVNDFEFKEGIQWSKEEEETLKKRGQAATVENEIKPIIERIVGQYTTMKTKIIYKGRNVGTDEEHNNILSALALHVQQRSGYEFEEGDMFDDGQSCGMGVMEASIDYEDDLSPKVVLKAENILNIFPDPNSRRYDWNEDAEFICRAKWVSFNEAVQLYPDYKTEIEGYVNSNPVQNTSQVMERNHLIDERLKRIRLVEVWYKTWQKRKFAISNSIKGGVQDITDLPAKQFKEIKKLSDFKIHEKTEIKIRVGIFCGDSLLEDKESPYEHGLFPFVPYFVYRRKNGEPYSVVRMLKDPQMEINKRRSKALHLLSTNQAVFEEGGVRDEDTLRTEMSKPDGMLAYRKGFQFKIEKNIDLASSQIQLQNESKSSMARISGISDEAMARHSEVRSGIGIQRKQAMTDIVMSPIFNNLRRSRMMIGRLILELIRQFYNEEKVFDVTDDMNQVKHFTMTQDTIAKIKEGIYDVIIEEAPNIATIQEEQFAYLAELVKGLAIPPDVGSRLLPIFIKLSALKNKDEVSKILEQMLEQAQQVPPDRPKTSLSLTWSELYSEEKAAFAQMLGMDELAQFEMQSQRPPKQEVGNTNLEVEGQKAQMDMQIKGQKHQMDMQHMNEKHQQKMGMDIDKHQINMGRRGEQIEQGNNNQA